MIDILSLFVDGDIVSSDLILFLTYYIYITFVRINPLFDIIIILYT